MGAKMLSATLLNHLNAILDALIFSPVKCSVSTGHPLNNVNIMVNVKAYSGMVNQNLMENFCVLF